MTHDIYFTSLLLATPGAGVAGLAAIGTAKSMGAIVSAYDVRPVAREQVRVEA